MPLFMMVVVAIPLPVVLKIHTCAKDDVLSFLLSATAAVMASMASAWFVAIQKNERNVIISLLKKKLQKK